MRNTKALNPTLELSYDDKAAFTPSMGNRLSAKVESDAMFSRSKREACSRISPAATRRVPRAVSLCLLLLLLGDSRNARGHARLTFLAAAAPHVVFRHA